MRIAIHAVIVLLLALPAQGQTILTTLPVDVDASSGSISNATGITAQVWSEAISLPFAGSVQVEFGRVEFSHPDDCILVTGGTSGETQRLNRSDLEAWNFRSGWFNGTSISIALVLGPGSAGLVEVPRVHVTEPPNITQDAFCGGVDDRVASADNRSFRLFITFTNFTAGICTGWLVGSNSTFLSAGHCWEGATVSTAVGEFNVPASAANGAIVHPGLTSQFPVILATLVASTPGTAVGNDWSVARLTTNNIGQSAAPLFGTFPLAQVLPANGTLLRTRGYGADTTPLTANNTQQTSTGVQTQISGSEITFQVDVQPGNSGGPLLVDSNSDGIGIVTHEGCFPGGGANVATNILHTPLQHAIALQSSCQTLNLTGTGSGQTVNCTPARFIPLVNSNVWNAVFVSSAASDWDCTIGAVSSVQAGTACDFLIANGNLGALAAFSGSFSRWSGTTTATAHYATALTMATNSATSFTFDSNRVGQIVQFNVTTAGSHQIQITGDASLSFELHSPGTSNAWRARQAPGVLSSGLVSAASINVTLSTGWHALVIFRNGGPAALANPTVGVTICTGVSNLVLSSGGVATVTAGCQPFTANILSSNWNVVGIVSPSDWNVQLGGANSSLPGTDCEFVAANGKIGAIPATSGIFARSSGTDPATVEHATATTVNLGIPVDTTLPSGRILRAFQFAVFFPGNFDVYVAADPSLKWTLLGPGTNASWRARSSALAERLGGQTFSGALASGWHCVVVSRVGTPAASAMDLTVVACSAAAPVTLTANAAPTVIGAGCQAWTLPPPAPRWYGVGVASIADWNVHSGSVESQLPLPSSDYLVYNGHAGVGPLTGFLTRASGILPGDAQHADAQPLAFNSPFSGTFASTDVLRLFEFDVTVPATYTLSMTGSASVGWTLFSSGGAVWRPRAAGLVTGTLAGGGTSLALATGWHAIVLSRDGAAAASGFSVEVSAPNPVPILNSLSASSLLAGGPSTTLSANGQDFVASSTVLWNGAPLPTTFVSATQLSASVSSSLLATPGSALITVSTPGPGGGVTSALSLSIRAPFVTSVNPGTIPVMTGASPPVVLTLQGTDFAPSAQVFAYNIPLNVLSGTSTVITCELPATAPQVLESGGIGLTVRNFGLIQSNTVALNLGGNGNVGTINRNLTDPAALATYALVVEGCTANQPYTLAADLANPPLIPNIPNATANMNLAVYTPSLLALIDGIGIYGPALGVTLGNDPNGTPPGGVLTLPGFVEPASPLGLTIAVQLIYLDPAAVAGYRITHVRRFDDL